MKKEQPPAENTLDFVVREMAAEVGFAHVRVTNYAGHPDNEKWITVEREWIERLTSLINCAADDERTTASFYREGSDD